MAIGIRIRGLVQGVGFRPTVWRVAHELNLKGDIRNDGDGVWIRLNTQLASDADTFCELLQKELPSLARIDEIEIDQSINDFAASEFSITHSEATTPLTGIVPDSATCADCLKELKDPKDHRYHYPFINCTNCGPRLSIIKAIPYDRANTSMSVFKLCAACEKEYLDPADRRYHAQPNACADCGPKIWLDDIRDTEQVFRDAQKLLKQGGILAIKGIGGFHLACDAHNAEAVDLLRKRKRRYGKPFALMARDMAVIADYCDISKDEAELLQSPAAPIVLLNKKPDGKALAPSVAADQRDLGFMLPYSPIHHLLLESWDTPLIMTSGNLSDKPQCTDNDDAATRLHDIADKALLHNREIVNRVDDSVVRFMNERPRFYRRARGYAPAPLILDESFTNTSPILALGAELKNTICLLNKTRATISQHLGDLEDARTSDEFIRTVKLYSQVFDFRPTHIAVDKHPNYRSTLYGKELAAEMDLPIEEVQHHHAHIASVMAENGLAIDHKPILGIALDGLGYGDDGTLWGGEFLEVDFKTYKRLGHINSVAMPGATKAILEPWRNLYAQLKHHHSWQMITKEHSQLPIVQYLLSQPVDMLDHMIQAKINSPLSSSAGRLFDALAAALGIHHERVYHEGQAAIALEQLALSTNSEGPDYHFQVENHGSELTLETRSLWSALFKDLQSGVSRSAIARGFHRGFADSISNLAIKLCEQNNLDTVALSGGVFQNKIIFESCINDMTQKGLRVISHEKLPSNDGGISLGQATIAAARHSS